MIRYKHTLFVLLAALSTSQAWALGQSGTTSEPTTTGKTVQQPPVKPAQPLEPLPPIKKIKKIKQAEKKEPANP